MSGAVMGVAKCCIKEKARSANPGVILFYYPGAREGAVTPALLPRRSNYAGSKTHFTWLLLPRCVVKLPLLGFTTQAKELPR